MASESRIVVAYEGKEYGVVLPVQGLFLDKVKKMVAEKLKSCYPREYKDDEIDLRDLTFYCDDVRTVEINDKKMPSGRKFYAKLAAPMNAISPPDSDAILFSGIDLKHPEHIFPRPVLLQKLSNGLHYRHFLLYAPPATGKTALAQMLCAQLHGVSVISLQCASIPPSECFDVLLRNGVDLKNGKTTLTSETVFILDDCHAWFGCNEFWNAILKGLDQWCPRYIRFLYIATQLLSKSTPSPIYFSSLPSLRREDFLLSKQESMDAIERIGSKFGDTFANVLVEECAGIIGLISLTLGFLRMDFRFGTTIPSESDVLRHFYSQRFTPYLARCFCFDTNHARLLTSSAIEILQTIFSATNPITVDLSTLYNEGFIELKNAGIIVSEEGLYKFSSPYAKRYLFNLIFPTRSHSGPTDINDFVLRAVARMSSNQLTNSVVPNTEDFPKEAAFQHLLLCGFAAESPPSVCICPELGRRFPGNSGEDATHIDGEIDFYVDGDIRWGIEILVGGDRVGNHLARCRRDGGKYAALEMLDYVVIDFRRGTARTLPGVQRHPKRMTIVFPADNFSSCQAIVGHAEEPVDIQLQP